jgi:hypothetical protein
MHFQIGTGCRRRLRLEQMGVRVVALGLFGESKVVEVAAAAVVFPGVLPRLWGLESAFGVGYSAVVPGLRWVGWAESATGKRRRGSGDGEAATVKWRRGWDSDRAPPDVARCRL